MRRQAYPYTIFGSIAFIILLIFIGTQQSFSFQSHDTRTRPLSGTPAEQAELERLYQAALQKGQTEVVVYQAAMDYEWQPLWKAFSEAFPGIQIKYMHLSPAEIFNRLDTETVTGSHFADIVSYPINNIFDLKAKGYLSSFKSINAEKLPNYYRTQDDTIQFSFLKVYGLGFNKNRLGNEQLPETIHELLSKKWEKQFEYGAPGGGAGTVDIALIQLLQKNKITEQDLHNLKKNGGIGGTQEQGTIVLAQSRTTLSPWVYLPPLARQKALGVPIEISYPADFTLLIPFGQGLVKNPAHPEAAKLLQTWLLTPDVQKLFAEETFSYGTIPNAPRPQGLPTSVNNQIDDPSLYPEALSNLIKKWVPKFQSIWYS